MSFKLAINGGKPIVDTPFPHQLTISWQEREAVNNLMIEASNGKANLSSFRGNYNTNLDEPGFYGGPWIQKLENKWSNYFNTQYSIAVNSCTSALQIACGAIGLAPGDEVIVTPWSMSCSATAPLVWNAIPVFADITSTDYCLDPESIEKRITDKTKAIIVVDLFGQPADYEKIIKIAKDYNLYIIEDAAQAVGSMWKGKFAGTIGDIGCFSFTQGKHLTAGEGGMIVTNNSDLALRCQMIRNHAEAVANDMGLEYYNKVDLCINNMLGFNLRMTEIQAAILYYQLDKLNDFVYKRRYIAAKIYEGIKDIPIIKSTYNSIDRTHSYYVQPMNYINNESRIHRNLFVKAITAELTGEKGRPDKPMLGCGYIKPLYLMPLFSNLRLYGGTSSPWNKSQFHYSEGVCPVAERLWKDDLFYCMYHGLPLNEIQIQYVIDAFVKVYENMRELI